MPTLFLIEIGFGNEKQSFLMVGEDSDSIETRVREENNNRNIEWIHVIGIPKVDQYNIKLITN